MTYCCTPQSVRYLRHCRGTLTGRGTGIHGRSHIDIPPQLGCTHRVSSVARPHSNCSVELGMKTVNRMLVGSTGPGGSLNTDAFQRAMLAYRNTPDPVSRVSSSLDAAFDTSFQRNVDSIYHTGLGAKHWKQGMMRYVSDT